MSYSLQAFVQFAFCRQSKVERPTAGGAASGRFLLVRSSKARAVGKVSVVTSSSMGCSDDAICVQEVSKIIELTSEFELDIYVTEMWTFGGIVGNVVFISFLSYLLDAEQYNLETVKFVNDRIQFTPPHLGLFGDLLLDALTIALFSYALHLHMVKDSGKKHKYDVDDRQSLHTYRLIFSSPSMSSTIQHSNSTVPFCSTSFSDWKGHSKLDYGGVAYEACAHSFRFLRPYKNLAKAIVNTAILGLQLGICSVFYVFMALHMKEIFDDETSFKVSATSWMFIIFPPVLLISFLRSMRMIIIFIGNVLMIGAFKFILQSRPCDVPMSWITNFDGVMTACGSILYSFEGQAMGMIGPGCLSLPLAFKQAGLWTAFGLVFAFGFLNNHCMLHLVHCSQHLSKR
ncbi:transmembrane amino acid transporter protein domain-containing protein [Ditylenchus destructor]|uniref:Transmembrane amino acid transporter protein domain-containing protein n=1 Tax=Ditylenchus destructor TaxID=166010 RepID=A0AAD4MSX2_9BILA|nr:transmembrane amino acid transporter protein domain-containing protein [Ditylenchus destructor]